MKIYNWLFTMYGGRIRFATPMLWSLGFILTFVIGGMTGVLLAVPPADFLLHNSLFLVAHFHNVIIGGVVFAGFAGIAYWFPKAFGFRLHEALGQGGVLADADRVLRGVHSALCGGPAGHDAATAALRRAGVAPVGGRGRVRRHHPGGGGGLPGDTALVSIRRRDELRDMTGDPWDGRSLEWATASPPPPFNFAVLPKVHGEEPYWEIKRRAIETQQLPSEPDYQPIEVPRNSPTGLITAFFATFTGFALIWHIWWLAVPGLSRPHMRCSCGSRGATWTNTRSRPRRWRGSTVRAGSSGNDGWRNTRAG